MSCGEKCEIGDKTNFCAYRKNYKTLFAVNISVICHIKALDRVQNEGAKFPNHTNDSPWETLAQCRNLARICAQFKAYIGERAWQYRGADNSLARPGRKQARKHIRDAHNFNNIETRAVIKFFSLQGKAPKEIHAFLTETIACLLPGRAKDLSAPLYRGQVKRTGMITIVKLGPGNKE